MLNYIKDNTLFKKINANAYSIIIIILCLFVIFPFVFLAQYNIPGASDDLFHGWFKIDKSYFEGIWSWYSDGYNGRFANAFFMLLPDRFFLKPGFGKVFPLFLMSMLFVSIFYLIKAYNRKSNTRKNLFFTTVLFSFYLAITPDIHQFYWYSGATVYVVPAVFYFFYLGLQLKAIQTKLSVWKVILSILLLFFVVGSNENWMVIGLVTSVLFFVNPILLKKRPTIGQILILAFTLIFAFMVVFAPGTSDRISAEGQRIVNANFLASFSLATFNIFDFLTKWFLNWGGLITMLGMLIVFSHESNRNNVLKSFSNKFIIYLLLLLIFAGILIMLYSLGHFVPIRERGVVPTFFLSTLVLVFIVFRLSQHDKLKSKLNYFTKKTGFFILSVGMIFIFSNSSNVKNAYSDIFSENAKEAAEQSVWVQNYIKCNTSSEILIPQLNRKTKTLYTFYIPENQNGWYHWAAVKYFNKKKILIDKTRTLEEFIKIKSNPDGHVINSGNMFCDIGGFNIDDVLQKDAPNIHVKATICHISSESEAKLVFESNPFWKGILITDIMDEDGNIDFIWRLPLDSTFNQDVLKVYLFNPLNDNVLVKPISAEIINKEIPVIPQLEIN